LPKNAKSILLFFREAVFLPATAVLLLMLSSDPLFSDGTYAPQTDDNALFDNLLLKQSFMVRHINNRDAYTTSPYLLALMEGRVSEERYDIDLGVMVYKDRNESGAVFNQASLSYLGDAFEFKIGKYVRTLGVLDYLSTINLLNPARAEFFDDQNINIRRIPLLMAGVTYYANDQWRFQAVVQPYNADHQDFTSAYLNFILDAFLPSYFQSLTAGKGSIDQINQEIFLPVYNDSISPALNTNIKNRYDASSTLNAEKAGIVIAAEYTGASANYGAVWMNRYSEIPYIEVDQDLLDAVRIFEHNEDSSQSFDDYLSQNDLDPITKVEGYRYNQYNLYAEGTIGSYGIRAETSLRDKLPIINEYSWLSAVGIGIDHKNGKIYNDLELQWLHTDSNGENIYAAILATKFDAVEFGDLKLSFDNYLLMGYYNSMSEITWFPNITLSRNGYSVVMQYLASKEKPQINSASIIVKALF